MTDNIKTLFDRIKNDLSTEHLKRISIDIISAYKNSNYKRLQQYASIQQVDRTLNKTKLFSVLIKQYHPDKRNNIINLARYYFNNNDRKNLQVLHAKYFFDIGSAEPSDHTIEHEEVYGYDPADFGYREKDIHEEDDLGESALDFGEPGTGFIDAVNRMFYGGLDRSMGLQDLEKLDGELDLSDYEISDLTGLEHCRYVTELNLSGNNIIRIGRVSQLVYLENLFLAANRIESIDCLKDLDHLKELDISFNEITDISVLSEIASLEYVNIMGNPISDYSVINELLDRAVIVIHEQTNLIL